LLAFFFYIIKSYYQFIYNNHIIHATMQEVCGKQRLSMQEKLNIPYFEWDW